MPFYLLAILDSKFLGVFFAVSPSYSAFFELALSTYYVVGALGNEWVFPTREGYLRNMSAITKLVSDTKQANKTFYRTERLEAQTGNDSMKFNYNGISQFSSIRNTASSSTLDRLGFKSEGTNLNLRYQNNTIIADSLFGIKYNLSNFDLNKYGFNHVTSEKTMGLYQNNNASQLAILTDGIYKNIDFTVNTLDNQTSLLNALSGLNLTYFKRAPSQLFDQDAKSLNQRVAKNVSNSNQDFVTITYRSSLHHIVNSMLVFLIFLGPMTITTLCQLL